MRYPWGIRVLGTLLGFAYTLSASPGVPPDNTTLTYEYVVVGSGAGGGPVAARLALAGHSVLLIEAGDDQGGNLNYTVPAFEAKVTEDPELAWDFYVRHYEDDARQKLDYKLTYDTQDGGLYTGLDPPAGAKIKGVLYPRAATLGGCTAHNALVAIYPDRDDFQYIADLTGDTSWNPDNIRQYFVKMENNKYLPPAQTGHGYNGWLGIETAPITLALGDTTLLGQLLGGAAALSNLTGLVINLASLLTGDANSAAPTRDSTPTLYQIPISSFNGTRNGAREFVLSVANARNADGSKMYPLDIRLNTYVTKVNFDTSGATPKATGVSFRDGKYLYRASKRAASAAPGTSGTVTATREVIVSGGTYNSPQILKLSGIGPANELESFGIPVIKDLPGVGTNLQDHYEVVVQGQQANNFSILNGCSFGFWEPDNCLQQWQTSGILPGNNRGTYASSGFAGSLFFKSSSTPDGNYDEFLFGGPVNFRGYFPGYSVNATIEHNWWSWAMLKSHPRNRAGTIKLNSPDPLEPPNISFNYFDTGSGDYEADVNTIIESIDLARAAFRNQTTPFTEILPGAEVQSREDLEAYIKNTAWGHHASCTCAIGADNDPMAVLDSSFRVRGVSGLRVVDASVYPKIPGTFTALSTYLVGEKAADVILSQLAASG